MERQAFRLTLFTLILSASVWAEQSPQLLQLDLKPAQVPAQTPVTPAPTTAPAQPSAPVVVNTPPATPVVQAVAPPPAKALVDAALPAAPEASVILFQNGFHPAQVKLPSDTTVRLWFTTVDTKPAALVVEGIKNQRWIPAESATGFQNATTDFFELQRELVQQRVTEVSFRLSAGKYAFYDALSGARGELLVE